MRFRGKSLMGAGRAQLLREIEKTGSLSTAARQMGMSYRHAWGVIQRMEEIWGEKIVTSDRGGAERGHTSLTDAGRRLLSEFENRRSLLSKAHASCFEKPNLAADGILVLEGKLTLVRRKHEPFAGQHALPGGFVEYGETLEECVVREFREETGLRTSIQRLIGVYSDPRRDPRGHTVSAAYELRLEGGELSDSDETSVALFPLQNLPSLAFDHERIVADFLRRTSHS